MLIFQTMLLLLWHIRSCAVKSVKPCVGARWCSSTSGAEISVVEIRKNGENSRKDISTEDFLMAIPKRLPLRDLRMLLRSTANVKRIPALLPRPSADCFIFDIDPIRLVCYSDRCLVFEPDRNIMANFIQEINDDLLGESSNNKLVKTNGSCSITHFYKQSVLQDSDFEHIILENALHNIVKKFKRHLEIIKPALDMLLQQIAQDPTTHNLRRLLAFRKSLSEFEQNVAQCMKVVQNLMANDEDLVGLYLSRPTREINDHEELELLFEAYFADFEEIEAEIRAVKEMIEDTNQFISTHLDTVRNKMIRMSLFMEMGALALGSGAVVGGIFGMNLPHGLEEHPTAFFMALGGMTVMMSGIFIGFSTNYNKLKVDTSSAQSFKALKNFFTYVDDLEYIVNKRKLNEKEFKEALHTLTGLRVTNEESEFIFKMFDANKDGIISTVDELNIHNDIESLKGIRKTRKVLVKEAGKEFSD